MRNKWSVRVKKHNPNGKQKEKESRDLRSLRLTLVQVQEKV